MSGGGIRDLVWGSRDVRSKRRSMFRKGSEVIHESLRAGPEPKRKNMFSIPDWKGPEEIHECLGAGPEPKRRNMFSIPDWKGPEVIHECLGAGPESKRRNLFPRWERRSVFPIPGSKGPELKHGCLGAGWKTYKRLDAAGRELKYRSNHRSMPGFPCYAGYDNGLLYRSKVDVFAKAALSSFNERSLYQQGPEYELIHALAVISSPAQTGCRHHCNFTARLKNQSEAEEMLFFADVRPGKINDYDCHSCCILGPKTTKTGECGCNSCGRHPGLIQHPVDWVYEDPNSFEYKLGAPDGRILPDIEFNYGSLISDEEY